MKTHALLAAAAAAIAIPHAAQAADGGGQDAFLGTYRELVETDTTLSSGSCTLAAQRMAGRLAEAGVPAANLHLFAVDEHPEEGGLVAIYPGSGEGAVLLMAHIDVVEADPEDWERDPFTFIEENGVFHGRGVADDKAQAAIFTDMLVRFAKEGYRPTSTIKMALTCGEETNGAFNGMEWLTRERRDLIDAGFALNEGGGGDLDKSGVVVTQSVQVGEKIFANFELIARNPGGHSAAPRPDNAIYALADALRKVEAIRFPVQFTDVTRRSFMESGVRLGGEKGDAIIALARDPGDEAADEIVSADPYLRGNSRTTCVATTLNGGHARNALAQKAVANINCRIFPGNAIKDIQQVLIDAIGNPDIAVTLLEPIRPSFDVPPLDPAVIGPMEQMVAAHYPHAKFTVSMSNGYTDSAFTNAAGIPTYGIPGLYSGPGGSGAHGVNERIPVAAVMRARAFLTDLVRAYAD